jgi:hypothetical protein
VSEFEGVILIGVRESAAAKFGDDLRREARATYLLGDAGDGYRAVFPLPELDPGCTDPVVLLADRRDWRPVDVNEGPCALSSPMKTGTLVGSVRVPP